MEAPSFRVLLVSKPPKRREEGYRIETLVINGLSNVFTTIESTSPEGIRCYLIQLTNEIIIQLQFPTIKEAKDAFEWLHSISGNHGGRQRNGAKLKGVIFTIPIQRKDTRWVLRHNHCKDYFVMNTHIPAHTHTVKRWKQYG